MGKNSRYIQQARKSKNFGYNTDSRIKSTNLGGDKSRVVENLSNYISPVQLQRFRTDVSMWRDAIAEAERAYYPFRVKMQRIFIDTILNGHAFALIERRKDLTLLRKYAIQNEIRTINKEVTNQFNNMNWFKDFLNYTLDALFYGYSLISLGDIVADEIKECTLIPRWFISPDREQVGSYLYATGGVDFKEQPYADWHVYVKTASENGVSPCGYGLLYQMALYEIFLRNTLGFNGDYVELFAMPYRVGKTTKQDETERAEFEAAVRDMGSAAYAVVDPMDEIEFISASTGSGSGFQSYDNLEKRCEAKLSKIVLGHEDAISSMPGRLGSGQGEEKSPVAKALEDKQTKDGEFVENIINSLLIPKLTALGILSIPDGFKFKFLNNGEEQEIREREDSSNLKTAQIALAMKNAGLKMDAAYFSKRTGITATEIEEPEPIEPKAGDKEDLRNNSQVKNSLESLYS